MDQFCDEVDVLNSIYGDRVSVDTDRQPDGCYATVTYLDDNNQYTITFYVPTGYPTSAKPTYALSFESRIDSTQKQILVDELNGLITESGEEVVLFAAIERLKELATSITPTTDSCISHRAESETETVLVCENTKVFGNTAAINYPINIIHGPVMMEQKSSFQSHIAAVHSMEDVHMFRQIVLSDKKIARATHNIFAYRFTCPNGTGVVYHDNDDDGECAAGGRLAEMIRLMGIDGVAVIVSRWFGGILLGPDRFKFICNSARNLLEDNGYGKAPVGKKKS